MLYPKQSSYKEELKLQKEKDKQWANYIKDRDNYTCQFCGSIYYPSAHHIIPREIKQYRYLYDNGITLCRKHHKFCRTLSAHNAPLAFFLWLKCYKTDLFLCASGRIVELLKGECKLWNTT